MCAQCIVLVAFFEQLFAIAFRLPVQLTGAGGEVRSALANDSLRMAELEVRQYPL